MVVIVCILAETVKNGCIHVTSYTNGVVPLWGFPNHPVPFVNVTYPHQHTARLSTDLNSDTQSWVKACQPFLKHFGSLCAFERMSR